MNRCVNQLTRPHISKPLPQENKLRPLEPILRYELLDPNGYERPLVPRETLRRGQKQTHPIRGPTVRRGFQRHRGVAFQEMPHDVAAGNSDAFTHGRRGNGATIAVEFYRQGSPCNDFIVGVRESIDRRRGPPPTPRQKLTVPHRADPVPKEDELRPTVSILTDERLRYNWHRGPHFPRQPVARTQEELDFVSGPNIRSRAHESVCLARPELLPHVAICAAHAGVQIGEVDSVFVAIELDGEPVGSDDEVVRIGKAATI